MSPDLIRPATSGVALRELVAHLGVAPDHRFDGDPLVTGVSLDSRAVAPGDLYAALPGFNAHGADFAPQAVQRGAVAVLTDAVGADRVAVGVPVVVVEHPREILGAVAARVYGHPSVDLTMIGVTGTNGKTTTAYLIESALRAHGRRTGLIGTVETRLGDEVLHSERTTPETTDLHALLALMRQRGLDTCVMEVSSHALALHRVDGVVYDVALFTNLSQDHLDFHTDMEGYYRAKASLFTAARSRRAVVSVDDEWGVRLAAEAGVPVTTLSTGGTPADWMLDGSSDDGSFTLSARDGSQLELISHLTGTFNVANTAMAALALLAIGLEHREVEAALAVPPDVPGRMQLVDAGAPSSGDRPGRPRCIVDFAHTPDAIDAALVALRPSTSGRLIAVLGAGGDRDRGKRPRMGAAAARHADVVVVTDDNPRSEPPASIRAAVLAGARELVDAGSATATAIIDGGARAVAISRAVTMGVVGAGRGADLEPGEPGEPVDTVIVLGKGHEKGQEIDGVTHPFDDRDAVLAALSAAASGAAS